MKAIAYTRVSTDKQVDNGVSLDAQHEQVKSYAKLYGFELIDTVMDDGASAKTLDRPGIQRVLTMLDTGEAEAVIVPKLDRLTRSVHDLGYLLERYFNNGFTLASVAEQIDTRTANGRMMLNILTSVAQWEREVISERTKSALNHKRTKSERISGQMPYGYRLAADGISLEENPDEQAIIRKAKALRHEGCTIRQIRETLGAASRAGKPFTIAAVHKLVSGKGDLSRS